MSLLLKNTKVALLAPPLVEECDLRIDGGIITDRSRKLARRPGDEIVDISGSIIMPGFVCSHTHLYSALARGMPSPSVAPKNFVEILKKIWWRLDEALDDEAIYYSALVGAIESAKFGTTALVDHHASPNHISGSLDIIKQAIAKVGLRGVLCYETTDRGGMKRRDLGLAENERFVAENVNNSHFRGTIGAHASFTLSDDSLGQLGELGSMYDCGVHIHVAEDRADVLDASKKHKTDIIERLESHGVLRRKSILVHGVHLGKSQLAKIDKSGAWIIHNPRSNMNNAVGYAPLNWFGKRACLGTDGFPADMFLESQLGYFRNADSENRVEFSRLPVMVQNGQRLVSDFFGREFGTLDKGSPADLVVLHYDSPTPFTSKNLQGHFLFGMNSGMVMHAMVNGNWVVWNGQMAALDEATVMAKAAVVAKRLWGRMNGK